MDDYETVRITLINMLEELDKSLEEINLTMHIATDESTKVATTAKQTIAEILFVDLHD